MGTCAAGKASTPPRGMGLDAVAAAEAYAGRESAKVADLANLASDGGVAIWGMATKGVMMSAILGSDVILGGIDGNIRKQGKFAAGSGVSINPPDWVRELPHRTPTLLMNPNYAAEIGQTVRDLGADIRLVAV